ncbi:helix-turn-helix transcriptional regulator [Pseudomonas sp. zfem003]|uniref:helix-turn-helix domain-containing protein n=1 Tax=Pseudomonas sp. zfem003 TaxID=3078198 RepID=UPI0029277EB6|nr:helix-turn-helix transcriptional regulator [Pseudomonas sp. zfem003]MDU9399029.1 helix-turn-helix transcriptional regulator [Pseudomonas sp. zfem003]
MIPSTLFLNESLIHTIKSNTTSKAAQTGTKNNIARVVFEKPVAKTALEIEHSDFDAFMEALDSSAEHKEGMKEARLWVAEQLYAEEGDTIKSLRLKKGLTQKQLAQIIGTSQPQIAKLEKGLGDPLQSTCRRLREALGISADELEKAMDRQVELNMRNESYE